ncbi:MAG: D-alanyl-D-alanine carboxypeptidase/D-alanyl-D-alanine-endopeptidase [bacterium]|nr:D-alanyl-D-alanine carboxypeptidase/D-alanyl-D-alanine-endopeptidase [bacterium]
MRQIYKLSFLSIAILIINNCAGTYQRPLIISPEEQLARQIDLQIAEPELQTALVGVMVQSAETGEILYQRNANTLMMPASNEKIVTSIAALLKLGPDFHYKTDIYTTGQVEDGVLSGDLVIVGSGDPTFSYRFCEENARCFVFQSWADSLHARGIHSIKGNIIGIDDVFDDEFIGYGWSMNNLSSAYSAQIGGLMFNENKAQLILNADSSGEYLNISVIPDLGYVKLLPDLEINADETEITVDRRMETNLVRIKGKIQPGFQTKENLSIHDPTQYFLAGLKWELIRQGIQVYGEPIDADLVAGREKLSEKKPLFTHISPPFQEVLKILMKESQNLYAESLVKLLGKKFGKEGSFAEGEKIVKETLTRFGLEPNSYSYADGSGLCRYNYITPAMIANLLRNMYFHPYGEVYRQSLPIAGVDGTIGNRMKGTVAQNHIFAKTGTISNVRCLSGYAKTKDGETLVFSTMFNNFLCRVNVIMDIQDQMCMLMAAFSRKNIE